MIQKIAFTSQVPVQRVRNGSNIGISEPVEEKKNDSSALILGSLAVLGAFGLGMIARKPKVVEKIIEKSTKQVEQEEGKLYVKTRNKKQRIKHTTPNKNPKPINLEEQSRIINDIDASNSNNSSRKLLDDALEDTPTKAEIEASRSKYEAPNQQQKNDIANLHSSNRQQRKELNSIGSQTEVIIKPKIQTKSINSGYYAHANGNQYIVENGRVVKILDKNSQKGKVIEVTDEIKIAKHIAKHNVNLNELTFVKKVSSKKSKQVA